jgi:hypothetical protein
MASGSLDRAVPLIERNSGYRADWTAWPSPEANFFQVLRFRVYYRRPKIQYFSPVPLLGAVRLIQGLECTIRDSDVRDFRKPGGKITIVPHVWGSFSNNVCRQVGGDVR